MVWYEKDIGLENSPKEKPEAKVVKRNECAGEIYAEAIESSCGYGVRGRVAL